MAALLITSIYCIIIDFNENKLCKYRLHPKYDELQNTLITFSLSMHIKKEENNSSLYNYSFKAFFVNNLYVSNIIIDFNLLILTNFQYLHSLFSIKAFFSHVNKRFFRGINLLLMINLKICLSLLPMFFTDNKVEAQIIQKRSIKDKNIDRYNLQILLGQIIESFMYSILASIINMLVNVIINIIHNKDLKMDVIQHHLVYIKTLFNKHINKINTETKSSWRRKIIKVKLAIKFIFLLKNYKRIFNNKKRSMKEKSLISYDNNRSRGSSKSNDNSTINSNVSLKNSSSRLLRNNKSLFKDHDYKNDKANNNVLIHNNNSNNKNSINNIHNKSKISFLSFNPNKAYKIVNNIYENEHNKPPIVKTNFTFSTENLIKHKSILLDANSYSKRNTLKRVDSKEEQTNRLYRKSNINKRDSTIRQIKEKNKIFISTSNIEEVRIYLKNILQIIIILVSWYYSIIFIQNVYKKYRNNIISIVIIPVFSTLILNLFATDLIIIFLFSSIVWLVNEKRVLGASGIMLKIINSVINPLIKDLHEVFRLLKDLENAQQNYIVN